MPIEVIIRDSRLIETRAYRSLSKLNKMKLIKRRLGTYTGYTLTYLGLDCLALRSLVNRGVLAALGDKMGVGKESDVYEALTPADEKVTVKFHRIGRTSFRQVRRLRVYTADKPKLAWLVQAKISAEREFAALDLVYKAGGKVPKPIARSRHAVVTSYIEGVELREYLDPIDPRDLLMQVLDTVRKAYLVAGIVHGDLSEYNIIARRLEDEGRDDAIVIDWPQYVEKDHPSAKQLLSRDVYYVVRFFRKKYGVQVNEDDALAYVEGRRETLL